MFSSIPKYSQNTNYQYMHTQRHYEVQHTGDLKDTRGITYHLSWTQTRTLDVDQSPFPAREVQPPLIYVRGDGRLNNTQSQNQSTNLYFLSPTLVFDLRSPRGKRIDLGQPIADARPDGFHPGRVGFWVSKALGELSCVSCFR